MSEPTPRAEPIRPFDREAFWTLVVALPALISILRLWAEAGGDLETTLLLVSNVGPVNLIAGLVVTATWLVSAVLVAIFAIGTVTRAALPGGTERYGWAALFARLAAAAPGWLRLIAFVLAALTWQLLFLPWLILAACAAFGWYPSGPRRRLVGWVLAGAGYLAATGPVVAAAVGRGYVVPLLHLLGPPVLLALGAARPMPAAAARPFASATQAGTALLALAAAAPVLATPVLPLSVVTVGVADEDQPPQPIRGHVVEVNDATTAILRAHGGVVFVDNQQVKARVLCPDEGATPRYRLWILGVHVENSFLQGAGRLRRPATPVDPRCRPTIPERAAGDEPA
ncbi:hypothetical protein [Plantactinospora sp. KBS50]|uniref:hypothetical protein n=1 Tax=Plantactinospora sp. KBS50 TaxID=2024580 RepID=UPI000BAB163F|nr:hypothetical protein [Plantactinospora sp. KBS50]ASW55813.1 hypothetical protein CIK06_19005 [Plantactinospora sp. KBS50]